MVARALANSFFVGNRFDDNNFNHLNTNDKIKSTVMTTTTTTTTNFSGSEIGGRKISFFMRKGADCLSKWVGEAEKQLRLLFQQAFEHQPSIIFFDEIDGLAPVRSSKQDQIHSKNKQKKKRNPLKIAQNKNNNNFELIYKKKKNNKLRFNCFDSFVVDGWNREKRTSNRNWIYKSY